MLYYLHNEHTFFLEKPMHIVHSVYLGKTANFFIMMSTLHLAFPRTRAQPYGSLRKLHAAATKQSHVNGASSTRLWTGVQYKPHLGSTYKNDQSNCTASKCYQNYE